MNKKEKTNTVYILSLYVGRGDDKYKFIGESTIFLLELEIPYKVLRS